VKRSKTVKATRTAVPYATEAEKQDLTKVPVTDKALAAPSRPVTDEELRRVPDLLKPFLPKD
jgi:hypothetical protein